MLNNPTERDGDHGVDGSRTRREQGAERLIDREVPIGQFQMPLAIHEWLDGEGSEATARVSDNPRNVEFWALVRAETERRRVVSAPSTLQQRIMAQLGQAQPVAVAPWYQRPL
jgi:hypothetical protein